MCGDPRSSMNLGVPAPSLLSDQWRTLTEILTGVSR